MCGMQIAMTDAIEAGTVHYPAADGDEIEAYTAHPRTRAARRRRAHPPPAGLRRGDEEYARTFAVHGYNAVVPNLYCREAPGRIPSDAAAAVRANGGVPDERLVGDVGAAPRSICGPGTANGKVGVIGHCSGGRQALLAACLLDLQAAVDCYGAFVMADSPASDRSARHLAGGRSCRACRARCSACRRRRPVPRRRRRSRELARR